MNRLPTPTALFSLFLALLFLGLPVSASTAFTYQGRLNDAGVPAHGSYDLEFSLYDAEQAGSLLAGPVVIEDVLVADGFFTTPIDFGSIFDGTETFLAIGVRDGSDSGSFVGLSPRQAIRPTPFAQSAGSVDWSDVANVPSDLADGDDDGFSGLTCNEGEIPIETVAGWGCTSFSDSAIVAKVLVGDGPGSTLDADTVDGVQASQLATLAQHQAVESEVDTLETSVNTNTTTVGNHASSISNNATNVANLTTSLANATADLQSQVDAIPSRGFILGRTGNTKGRVASNGKFGFQGTHELCKATFANEPTAHLCSIPEIQYALATDSIGNNNISGVMTWTTTGNQNGINNCRGMMYQTGHLGTGSTITITLNSNVNGTIGHEFNTVTGVGCGTDLPILCCR